MASIFVLNETESTRTARRWLNTRQAAVYTGFSPRTLERWRYMHIGPVYARIGGRCRYAVDDLDRWLERARVMTKN